MSVDVLVVGGGPAGAGAAVALVERGHRVALVDPLGVGGRLLNVEHLHDRHGHPTGSLGWDRATELAEAVLTAGVELIFGQADSLAYDAPDRTWVVTVDGQQHRARCVLIAVGCRPEPVPGDEDGALHGKGVSYCAVCDAGLFRGQRVVVIGGGPIAMAEAASLAPVAAEVIVLVPTDRPTAAPAQITALSSAPNVTIRASATVVSVVPAGSAGSAGAGAVAGSAPLIVDHTDGAGATVIQTEVGGVFGAAGELPNSALLRGVATLDPAGFVVTDDAMACAGCPDCPDCSDCPGLFAAGDVRAGGHADLQGAEQDAQRAAIAIDAFLRTGLT